MEDSTVVVPTLGEVIAVLKEITDPHILGIHLGIEDHQLDKFEKNFPQNIDRQMTEVIKHWKRNYEDCSWSSLATAVEKMGNHANLVTKLRELHLKAVKSEGNNAVDGITTIKDHEGDHPTLKELKEYVWKSIGVKWEELAITLGLDEDEESKKKLDGIRERRKGDVSMASYEVLRLWQSNKRANPSWEKLIKALNTVGLLDAVRSITDYLVRGIEVKDNSSSVALMQQCSTSTNQEKIPTTKHYTVQMKGKQKVRNYQHELAAPGIKGENYIVVAPTNSGKTLVAGLVIANHLEMNPLQRSPPKVIMVVKTRPLANQQREKLQEYIPDAIVECRIGNRSDYLERQQQLHIKDALHLSDVIVCTAGKLRNELNGGMVTLQDFSLMIIDECHNTEKSSNYAQIMYMYLEQKTGSGSQLPQVMGLTATPGIGKNPGLNPAKAVDNLLNLCAIMDASSGIQTVQQHVDELAQVLHKPEYYRDVVDQSERRQVFIRRVEEEMKECEKFLNFDFVDKLPRWSQKYEQAVKEMKTTLEENENPDDRDKISTIRLLECYSQTLISYMELPCVQAMLPLEKYDDLTTSDKLSDHENCLLQKFTMLKSDLASLDLRENPILEKLEERLTNTFKRKSESEGIVFVRTREQAEAISDWICDSKFAEMLNIRSHMLLGHNRTQDKGPSMSDEEQKMVVEAFHAGDYNLLIATSVAEEGLDIKRCNLVMRLHISSAKSKAQMQGRARADDSEIVTIMSNDPRTLYRDMLNDEQLLLMEKLVRNEFLPQHKILQEKIATIQVALRDSIRRQRELQESRMSTHPAKNVELKCKKCKIIACRGSDIYIIDKTNHHVVPGDTLRYELVEHSTPGMLEGCGNMNIEKLYKIHCTGCNASWGVLGTWPSKKEFPVLKCDCFNFYVNGRRSNFTKWKDRPFKVSPLSEWFAQTNQF